MKITNKTFSWWITFMIIAYIPMWFVALSGTFGKIAVILFIIGLLFFFICGMYTITIDKNNFNKDFYKTVDELQEERNKLDKEWSKVTKIINVIGAHEAIKLWEKNKENETSNDKLCTESEK